MKRVHVDLDQVASLANLELAFARALRGSPHAAEARAFRGRLDSELASLRHDMLTGELGLGNFRVFRIRDPKPRTIHAPSFRERVLHHAVIALIGPVLDRALVNDTFACRVGKGAHAAVTRAQAHLRRYPWYVQVDIKSYFASIRHDLLKGMLARRIKGGRVLALLGDIIDAHHDSPGRGLPIGALTSQHFANYYLAGLDRYLLEGIGVRGMVRYMDDVVWWCDDQQQVEDGLRLAGRFVSAQLDLRIKPGARIVGPSPARCAGDLSPAAPGRGDWPLARPQRREREGASAGAKAPRSPRPTKWGEVARRSRAGEGRSNGLRFCGFRIFPGAMRLSSRRWRRYALARRRVEAAYALGLVDAKGLQAGYAAALAITAHADARGFRREQLVRVPVRISC